MKLPFQKALGAFKPLGPMFRKNKWGLTAGLASLFIVDGLQLWIPRIIKQAVDALTDGSASAALLVRLGLWMVFIAVAMMAFRYLWRFFLLGHSRQVERDLRRSLYQRLQSLSPAYYHGTTTGDLMARTINDLNSVRMATGMGLAALADGLVLGAAAIAFMAVIDWRLTLLTIIPAPLVIVASRVYTRRMQKSYERVQARFGDMTERVREAFAGIRVVQAYGREQWAADRVEEESRGYVAENLTLAKSLSMFFPLMMVFTNLGLAIVIWKGGGLAILGRITTGDFVAFTIYLNLLTWPMMAMGWVTNLVQRGGASMARINAVLEQEPEITGPAPGAGPAPPIKGAVSFDGVDFSFSGQEGVALERVSLELDPGSVTALVGPVGSGKSTLLSLLIRLYDPQKGRVLLDGVDIREIPLEELRAGVGFGSQAPAVFSETIRENVVFGRERVSEQDVEAALETVMLADEVQAMEKGLDTLLGERGITLSGGQRQRLALARVLAGSPSVLVLDDCLSMVDVRTEEAIMDNLRQARKGRTLVLVSHRTRTIGQADSIVLLDGGRVAGRGSHARLMETSELYKTLYERQRLKEGLKG